MGVELAYTDAVARATESLYAKVANFIPKAEWIAYAPVIAEINRLKREKNAVILAGFQALLHRYSGQEDFLDGSPVANRTRREIEDLIGIVKVI